MDEADAYTIHAQLKLNETAPWIPVLGIPLQDASSRTSKPLKWLRYVVATVFGAEGELLDSDDNLLDYNDSQPVLREFYYHPSDVYRLVDSHSLEHFSSSEFSTGSRAHFRAELIERDGTCVLSGSAARYCIASHIIPKSKGDLYIQNMCLQRDTFNDSILSSIMNIKNALFMNKLLDGLHTECAFAVIRTPNFALNTDEILPNTPPPPLDQLRFTSNLFEEPYPGYEQKDLATPPIPDGSDWPIQWPPKWLWDFVYGFVCAKYYGTPPLSKFLGGQSDIHYPEGVKPAQDRTKQDIEKAQKELAERKTDQNKESGARASRRGGEREAVGQIDWPLVVANLWDVTRSTDWGRLQVAQHEKELEAEKEAAQAMAVRKSVARVTEWIK